MTSLRFRRLLSVLPVVAISACAVGPNYVRPTAATPAAYAPAPASGWVVASPGDQLDRAGWWRLFGDPLLNDLEERATRANQTIVAAEATYRKARGVVREDRASLFPTITLDGSATRSGSGGSNVSTVNTGSGTVVSGSSSKSRNTFSTSLGASWEPDLFGSIRRTIENARALADASLADLYSSQLAIQGEVATNYLNLRATDTEIDLYQQTVAAYQRALKIASNRYDAGIAVRTDVFEAQSQLASTQSALTGLTTDRRTYETALAVLVGVPASDFHIARAPRVTTIPQVPVALPSELLQRRPDIASSERAVAAANASVGVAKAAFFPTITLSPSGGVTASALSSLFSSSSSLWSLGASLAETVFDAGARSAQVQQARAGYDAAVAQYRETTLEAFEAVENALTAVQVLEQQEGQLRAASVASDLSEVSLLNQYRSGTVSYTDVVTAQATALTARRTLLQTSVQRQTIAVTLITALGGGWDESALRQPSAAASAAPARP